MASNARSECQLPFLALAMSSAEAFTEGLQRHSKQAMDYRCNLSCPEFHHALGEQLAIFFLLEPLRFSVKDPSAENRRPRGTGTPCLGAVLRRKDLNRPRIFISSAETFFWGSSGGRLFVQSPLVSHKRPYVGVSQVRSWSHFVGIYRQNLTRSLEN